MFIYYSNSQLIQTRQILNHCKFEDCNSHRIFLCHSKWQQIWNGKLQIYSKLFQVFLRKSVNCSWNYIATHIRNLTLHEVYDKYHRTWRIWHKPKSIVNILETNREKIEVYHSTLDQFIFLALIMYEIYNFGKLKLGKFKIKIMSISN